MLPEVVIVLKTWQGPREREVGQARLDAFSKTVEGLRKHLIYPNYSWHLADDGSDRWYQEAAGEHFSPGESTFSCTEANGDPGRNLNLGMDYALGMGRADLVLHWSDDIVLESDLDLRPYVELLETYPGIGMVRLRPGHPSIEAHEVGLCGRLWHLIDGAVRFAVDTSLVLEHRRFWDFYGPYPEGLRLDIMQEEMTWRYQRMEDGPRIVVPDELWEAPHPKCLGPTTWEWQVEEKGKPSVWYRSYSARG